jgi:hypothetical protein
MAYTDEDDGIECEIIQSYGIFSQGTKNWNKEINLVSWNGRPAKLDIRAWHKDHEKCGKGITLTWEEAEALSALLAKVLKTKTRGAKSSRTEKKTQTKKRPVPPATLEPFYDELELLFGASAEACKKARNTLLKKYHPDKNAANTAFATRKTIKIKEAYDKIAAWWKLNGGD